MKKLCTILLAVVALGGYCLGSFFPFRSLQVKLRKEEPIVCTMDAKECPDGSWVGRVPPNCEFAPCPETTEREISLFYYNPNLDRDENGDILCGQKGLVEVKRKIPVSKNLIEETIRLLLRGELTAEEKKQGVTTEFPLEGLELKEAFLKDGVLELNFNDPYYKTTGGSCRVGVLWSQIETTAKQFPEVREVRFSPEVLFQP